MLTEQQLKELADALRYPVSRFLKEPPRDVEVFLDLVEDPPRMRVAVRVRGEEVSSEREAAISQFLQAPRAGGPVY